MADETLIYTSKHYDSGEDIDAAIWHDNRDALDKITDDFIKILEMVFFYHNDIKYIPEIDDNIRIISDNNINDKTKKNLTIIDEKDKVVITFNMHSEYLDEYNYNDYIVINCKNGFGKHMSTEFLICNREVINDSINNNTHNLLYNINHLLSRCMADLFMKYYKII